MKPKVLILLQTKNSFIDLVKLNLEKNNYEVDVHPIDKTKKLKINWIIKLINLISFPFYKKGNFISKVQNKYTKQNNYNHELNLKSVTNKTFDYTLVFRADEFEDALLIKLKKKSKKFIAFHWDGLERTPNIFSKIKLFEDFYTFEPNDAINYKLKFITNFYFDFIELPKTKKAKWDITYIGYFNAQRFYLLNKLAKKHPLLRLNFSLKTFFINDKLMLESSNKINDLKDFYSYIELLKVHNNSNAILDIKAEIHNGLSFRFFEAIQLDKKIITTNSNVKQYDFYNSNNILVIDNSLDDLKDFLLKPFIPYSENIKIKYSFSNWFQNIIDSKNCIKIEMPYLNV
ncbi:hypothetical protein OBK28_01410 [Empedobacter falsenii]